MTHKQQARFFLPLLLLLLAVAVPIGQCRSVDRVRTFGHDTVRIGNLVSVATALAFVDTMASGSVTNMFLLQSCVLIMGSIPSEEGETTPLRTESHNHTAATTDDSDSELIGGSSVSCDNSTSSTSKVFDVSFSMLAPLKMGPEDKDYSFLSGCLFIFCVVTIIHALALIIVSRCWGMTASETQNKLIWGDLSARTWLMLFAGGAEKSWTLLFSLEAGGDGVSFFFGGVGLLCVSCTIGLLLYHQKRTFVRVFTHYTFLAAKKFDVLQLQTLSSEERRKLLSRLHHHAGKEVELHTVDETSIPNKSIVDAARNQIVDRAMERYEETSIETVKALTFVAKNPIMEYLVPSGFWRDVRSGSTIVGNIGDTTNRVSILERIVVLISDGTGSTSLWVTRSGVSVFLALIPLLASIPTIDSDFRLIVYAGIMGSWAIVTAVRRPFRRPHQNVLSPLLSMSLGMIPSCALFRDDLERYYYPCVVIACSISLLCGLLDVIVAVKEVEWRRIERRFREHVYQPVSPQRFPDPSESSNQPGGLSAPLLSFEGKKEFQASAFFSPLEHLLKYSSRSTRGVQTRETGSPTQEYPHRSSGEGLLAMNEAVFTLPPPRGQVGTSLSPILQHSPDTNLDFLHPAMFDDAEEIRQKRRVATMEHMMNIDVLPT